MINNHCLNRIYFQALIQLAAAGANGRDLAYFTFGNKKLRDNLVEIHRFLINNSVSVGKKSFHFVISYFISCFCVRATYYDIMSVWSLI